MSKTAFKMEAVFFSEAAFNPFLGELLVQNDTPALQSTHEFKADIDECSTEVDLFSRPLNRSIFLNKSLSMVTVISTQSSSSNSSTRVLIPPAPTRPTTEAISLQKQASFQREVEKP